MHVEMPGRSRDGSMVTLNAFFDTPISTSCTAYVKSCEMGQRLTYPASNLVDMTGRVATWLNKPKSNVLVVSQLVICRITHGSSRSRTSSEQEKRSIALAHVAKANAGAKKNRYMVVS